MIRMASQHDPANDCPCLPKRRGRKGERPSAIGPQQVKQIVSALDGGASKASMCRSKVPRSTLLDTLARAGWTGPAGEALPETAPRKSAL